MATKKQLTMKQVLETGKRVALWYGRNGESEIYEAAGCLFCIDINRDGYMTGMWCMGRKNRAARMYGIEIDD